MSILDVLKLFARYETRIQVCYYPTGYPIKKGTKEERSQIMKVKNVTYKHIDHWTFKKRVWKIAPCVDKQGKPYLFIQLEDIDRREDKKE